MMKSKIHRATVTDADLHYEGSLTLDADLMAAADLVEFEQVHVVNVNNGQRYVTYIIHGEPGSGVVKLNGPGARMGLPGDVVILISYADIEAAAAVAHQPTVVLVDGRNRVVTSPEDLGSSGR